MRTPLSPEQRIVYEKRLLEAEAAKHAIATGQQVEQFIDQNGEQVRYTTSNLEDLKGYIRELQEALNPLAAFLHRPRAIGFLF